MPGMATNECPVSAITPFSMVMVDQIGRAKRLKGELGILAFGPDASEIPAKIVDAIDVVTIEGWRVDNALSITRKDREEEED